MRKCIAGLVVGGWVLALPLLGRGGEADARALVEKAIKAAGGQAKVALLKAGTCKVKADIQDGNQMIKATIEVHWQGWDRHRFTVALDVNGMAKNAVIVINGAKAWVKDNDRNMTKDAPQDEVPKISAVISALRMPQLLPALLDKEIKLSPLGEVKVGDRPALGVSVTTKGDKQVSLFFDKENGLPVKSQVTVPERNGQDKTFEFLYRDYKDQNGVKQPTRISTTIDRADVSLELSDLRTLEKVEANLFAAPE